MTAKRKARRRHGRRGRVVDFGIFVDGKVVSLRGRSAHEVALELVGRSVVAGGKSDEGVSDGQIRVDV
jgi:hypothetical protein